MKFFSFYKKKLFYPNTESYNKLQKAIKYIF